MLWKKQQNFLPSTIQTQQNPAKPGSKTQNHDIDIDIEKEKDKLDKEQGRQDKDQS
mgnify:CR=1 FL=1